MLKRIGNMISATVNEGLDQIENPRVMLNHYLREIEGEIAKAKHAVVRQRTLEASFERKMEEAKNTAEKRKKQAQVAFDSGEENLARKALSEMKHYETKTGEYSQLHQKASEQVTELQEQLGKLEEKFQTLKDKKHALIARANAVKAKEHMHASVNRIDSESSFREFQRLEERITEMEIRTDTFLHPDLQSSPNKLNKLEYADDVESELEKMRASKNKETVAEKVVDKK